MKNAAMTRRSALKTTLLAAAAANAGIVNLAAEGVHWPLGCFNRPWMQKTDVTAQPTATPQPTNWGLDAALDGMKQAGFRMIGLLTRTKDDPFIGSEATDDYLAALKQKIAASGLSANMAALRVKAGGSVDDGVTDVHKQINNAQGLDLKWLLTFGVDDPNQYDTYCKILADAADYALERHLKLAIKPHGGSSGGSAEILDCLRKVGRPNFSVWFDAGNIIYYTGKDPVEELKPIAEHVTGFCAKDCDKQNGDVWLQLGRGKVNFRTVFETLRDGGFVGPIFLECAAGKSCAQINRATAADRAFLEKTMAQL